LQVERDRSDREADPDAAVATVVVAVLRGQHLHVSGEAIIQTGANALKTPKAKIRLMAIPPV
jgi:hypothetical protein